MFKIKIYGIFILFLIFLYIYKNLSNIKNTKIKEIEIKTYNYWYKSKLIVYICFFVLSFIILSFPNYKLLRNVNKNTINRVVSVLPIINQTIDLNNTRGLSAYLFLFISLICLSIIFYIFNKYFKPIDFRQYKSPLFEKQEVNKEQEEEDEKDLVKVEEYQIKQKSKTQTIKTVETIGTEMQTVYKKYKIMIDQIKIGQSNIAKNNFKVIDICNKIQSDDINDILNSCKEREVFILSVNEIESEFNTYLLNNYNNIDFCYKEIQQILSSLSVNEQKPIFDFNLPTPNEIKSCYNDFQNEKETFLKSINDVKQLIKLYTKSIFIKWDLHVGTFNIWNEQNISNIFERTILVKNNTILYGLNILLKVEPTKLLNYKLLPPVKDFISISNYIALFEEMKNDKNSNRDQIIEMIENSIDIILNNKNKANLNQLFFIITYLKYCENDIIVNKLLEIQSKCIYLLKPILLDPIVGSEQYLAFNLFFTLIFLSLNFNKIDITQYFTNNQIATLNRNSNNLQNKTYIYRDLFLHNYNKKLLPNVYSKNDIENIISLMQTYRTLLRFEIN